MAPGADNLFDAVIIGGGPAGLSAALVLGRCLRRVAVVDDNCPRNAAATGIHGFLGHDGIAPAELRRLGRKEVTRYGVRLFEDGVLRAERAMESVQYPTCFRLTTRGGHTLEARKLLFATGMRDVLPDFPGVRECYGASIHHCPYCDGYEHRGGRIVVYGDPPPSAVGLAIHLRSLSRHVTVLTHGSTLDAEHLARLSFRGIGLRTEMIQRIVHRARQLTGVELEGSKTLEADAMFFSTSQQSQCELPAQLGVICGNSGRGPTNEKQRTNVPGVLLAGDADGDVQFAIVAAAEGATAATAIHRELIEEDLAGDGVK